jgi:hypothetical protein
VSCLAANFWPPDQNCYATYATQDICSARQTQLSPRATFPMARMALYQMVPLFKINIYKEAIIFKYKALISEFPPNVNSLGLLIPNLSPYHKNSQNHSRSQLQAVDSCKLFEITTYKVRKPFVPPSFVVLSDACAWIPQGSSSVAMLKPRKFPTQL